MAFSPSVFPPKSRTLDSYWFVFKEGLLLVRCNQGKTVLPVLGDIQLLRLSFECETYLGAFNGRQCFSAESTRRDERVNGWEYVDLKVLSGSLKADVYRIAIYAVQIVNWEKTHRFCGRCGVRTRNQSNERAKICPDCGLTSFPRLSPAIMVAIINQNRILLAKGRRFPSGFFSVLAGFVEPGETLEECVSREVKEEVGLRVKNLTYFGSQPWPFPDSLMIAFIAEYAGGEIIVDGSEIEAAAWYTVDNLPRRPDKKLSIAGALIDWFEKRYGNKSTVV